MSLYYDKSNVQDIERNKLSFDNLGSSTDNLGLSGDEIGSVRESHQERQSITVNFYGAAVVQRVRINRNSGNATNDGWIFK